MILHRNILTKALAIAGALFLCDNVKSQTSSDSLHIKLPKHYFQTVIVADLYRKPEKKLPDTLDEIGKRLKTYGFKQFNLSFYTPLITLNDYNKDSTIIKNTHILLTGNYMLLQPVFAGLSQQHNLVKIGVGLRYIFNTGKKSVWFADVSPFVTKDITFNDSKGYLRFASTFVYSYNVNDRFNWRLGITKSFMWGNRFYLPFVGIRIGRLDKVNLSIQFPRSASLNVPINSKLIFSAYTSPQGGLYSFSNKDSIYFRNDKTFHFTQYQLNTGFRLDVRTGSWFNFYVATGFSTKNNITFYSERGNKLHPRLPYRTYFFSENTPPTLFLNIGIVLKFGKTRQYYNDKNIYDAIDLNNAPGIGNGNAQIPILKKQEKEAKNLKSIQDLIDYNDF